MRQDPDIVMVGEIRDGETADMAIQASLTGHLVLSTLHTNDAPSSLTRLHDLGVPSFLTSATILGVVAQRLVRTLCPHCKTPHAFDSHHSDFGKWQKLTQPWSIRTPTTLYAPNGCDKCRHTGFQGRIGLYEMLPVTDELKQLIAADAKLDDIKQLAYKQGVKPLRIEGAKRVFEGVTCLDEVIRVVPLT